LRHGDQAPPRSRQGARLDGPRTPGRPRLPGGPAGMDGEVPAGARLTPWVGSPRPHPLPSRLQPWPKVEVSKKFSPPRHVRPFLSISFDNRHNHLSDKAIAAAPEAPRGAPGRQHQLLINKSLDTPALRPRTGETVLIHLDGSVY